MSCPALPFERLDFIYTPSRDVAADAAHLTRVLGGRLVFAIEAFDTRVAMVRLGAESADLVLADHLEGEVPILIYRVADLNEAVASLEARGWAPRPRFGIPHGPCCAFRTPGGQRIAIYELTRPEVGSHFEGRRDFEIG